jgi:hypothetical protein
VLLAHSLSPILFHIVPFAQIGAIWEVGHLIVALHHGSLLSSLASGISLRRGQAMASTARGRCRLPSPEARTRARPLGGHDLVLTLITAGCVSPDAAGTTGDRPVLVTIAEKKVLGSDQQGKRNPAPRRRAHANREQIYAIVQPYLQHTLRRGVELTRISADDPRLIEPDPLHRTRPESTAGNTPVGRSREGQARRRRRGPDLSGISRRSRPTGRWHKLVDKATANVSLRLSVHLVLIDPDPELTEELARDVAVDIRSNLLFSRFDEWTVFTYGNLTGRESADFHRSLSMTVDEHHAHWMVNQWRGGATVNR